MKHRSSQERAEAALRLRNSTLQLKRLQHQLSHTGHPRGDPFRAAKIAEFWEKVRYDRRIEKGEI